MGKLQFTTKLHGFDGAYELIRSLPPEIVSKRGGPVKTGLRKGALVIHRQALANLQQVTHNATSKGKVLSTGLVAKNLIVSRGKAPIGGNGERYLVRVKKRPYTGRSGKSTERKAVTTVASAQMLEYGSRTQPAEPWLRPAATSRAADAISTIEKETVAAIGRIVKRLAKAKGAR